jgi:prepilin peptidase CpaA
MANADYALWAVAGLYAAVLVAAGVTDIRARKIPNWAVIALLLLFVPWLFVGPDVSWVSSLSAFAIALVVTVGLYLVRVIGAGDSKLFTAVALFAGLKLLGVLALATALIGGVIAIGIMIANPRRAVRGLTAKGRAEQGRGIPYGVPIALAALLVMFAPFGLAHDPQTAGLPKAGGLLAKPAAPSR